MNGIQLAGVGKRKSRQHIDQWAQLGPGAPQCGRPVLLEHTQLCMYVSPAVQCNRYIHNYVHICVHVHVCTHQHMHCTTCIITILLSTTTHLVVGIHACMHAPPTAHVHIYCIHYNIYYNI